MTSAGTGAPSASSPPPVPGAARSFAAAALGLALLPIAVEAAALDPRVLVGYREPLFAALRLALSNALPYLVVAASAGALATALAGRPAISAGRTSAVLLALAAGVAVLAAATTPAFHEALLAGDVRVEGPCARVGGPLSSCVELDPVPLEDAGELARVLVPARESPWQATVRWVGARTADAPALGARVELVAGGAALDVTDALRALPPGGAAVFSNAVRLGPDTGRIRLRLADDPLPPAVFFDAGRSLQVAGMAIDAGGGDRAWHAEPAKGVSALPVPTLRIEGEHVDGGHAVVVFSGEAWGVHDLGALLAARGELELALGAAADAAWRVRLVGDGAESAAIPLSALSRTEEDGVARYTLPLDDLAFGTLSPRLVVGVALSRDGPPGPFALDVAGARAAIGGRGRSGYALGTLAALDPGAPPAEAMIAVGEPAPGGPARYGAALRLVAAILGLLGAVGVSTVPRALRALPVRAAAASAVGPLLAVGLEPVVRALAAPRLEHLPLALGAAAVGAAVVALAGPRQEESTRAPTAGAHAPDPRLASVEALMGVAALGIVAAHVSADASGQPWVAHPPGERLLPLIVHALASGFEAPVFVLAALFVVATRRRRGAGRAIVGVVSRLLPALALWSAAYLLLRHGKAVAFGYEIAYRRELAQGATWLRAALLGGAQYHLYVLPLLLVLVVALPLYSPAVRRPALALGALATLAAWAALDAWIYAEVEAPEARTWALWGARAIGFSGYGLLAFALYGLADRARGLLLSVATLTALACAILLVRGAWGVADAGSWQVASRPAWFATWLLPAAVFTLFVASDRDWPTWLRRLGALAPGVYLVHPAVLDGFEILERGAGLGPAATVGVNFVGVSVVSVLLVAALARFGPLRSAVGVPPAGGAR